MDTSQIFLLFLLSAFASAANILRNEEAVVCDPAEDPSSCPTNRRCEDEDGDGEYNCVCDKRFYTTHTLGHCVLGFKELVYDMEKELVVLEEKQEHDTNWLNETLIELLEMPTTTVTTTTTTKVPEAQLTHSFCFSKCTDGITNAAPGADNSNPPDLGNSFVCDEGNGVTTGEALASAGQWIRIYPNIETAGPKTGAILVKHASAVANRSPREWKQPDMFVLNSNPFPHARAEVRNAANNICRLEVNDVFSTTEFVLVAVTADGTDLKMYRNGVEVGSKACSVEVGTNSNPLWLGENHLGGTIISFALWDRALSASEIAGLDSSKLSC